MRARIAVLSLSVFLGAAVSPAQNVAPAAPPIPEIDYSTVNCSGFVSDQKVPDEMRIISAEQSNYKIAFARGDYVHINRGQDKGVRCAHSEEQQERLPVCERAEVRQEHAEERQRDDHVPH